MAFERFDPQPEGGGVTERVGPGRQLDRRPAPILERRLDDGGVQVVAAGAPNFPVEIFGFITMFAVANTALINMLMASRLLYGMANEGVLPRIFGMVHPFRKTPDGKLVRTAMILGVTISACCWSERGNHEQEEKILHGDPEAQPPQGVIYAGELPESCHCGGPEGHLPGGIHCRRSNGAR